MEGRRESGMGGVLRRFGREKKGTRTVMDLPSPSVYELGVTKWGLASNLS